jgi:folylpolyglutamate synthase
MMELGLARITRLLKDSPISWRAIHVAGTNGKGSVCAYASAMLKAAKIKSGRLTSPHLIDRWDCVTIDEETVTEKLFYEVENVVKARDHNEGIKASEFELLTATAFEIFNREKVEIGVIEVGMGGRQDATNVLEHPSITVITNIGKDHEAFLGTTLEEIAHQKAGIMKTGVPCIVDGSNTPAVVDVLRKNAREVKAASLVLVPQETELEHQIWSTLPRDQFEEHQQMNVALAFEAIKQALAHETPTIKTHLLLPAIQKTRWPGRLQNISIEPLVGRKKDILLDGAHNEQSAKVLGSYVDRKIRQSGRPVTWVVAMSKGKNVHEVLSCFLRPRDNIVAFYFGPVDGMPWVSSEDVNIILGVAQGLDALGHRVGDSQGLDGALRVAVDITKGGPLVIAGSLYLVSDVLRLLRTAEQAR